MNFNLKTNMEIVSENKFEPNRNSKRNFPIKWKFENNEIRNEFAFKDKIKIVNENKFKVEFKFEMKIRKKSL